MSGQQQWDYDRERAIFLAWLDDPSNQAELRKSLGPDIDFNGFRAAAIDVITAPVNPKRPSLLRPDLRQSLLFSLRKAARHGLRPDGKEGALIPRQNNETRVYGVEWQPMVWGITKLGRATGAVKKINARIVYEGEPFDLLGGSEDKIVHRMLPQAMAAGLAKAIGAYCILTAPDGTETWRFLLRDDIFERRKVSAAFKAGGGPWIGPFEGEMWLKTVILHTAKWIELDPNSVAAKRFMDALGEDLRGDFDNTPEIEGRAEPEPVAAIAAPADRLTRYEDQVFGRNQRPPEYAATGGQGNGQESQPRNQQPQGQRPHGRTIDADGPTDSPPAGHPAHGGDGAPSSQGQQQSDPPKQTQPSPAQGVTGTAVARAPQSPQEGYDYVAVHVVNVSESKHDLLGALRGPAVQSLLRKLKRFSQADHYDPLVALVHGKLRALGASDSELKDLVNV